MNSELKFYKCSKSVLNTLPENMEVRGGLSLWDCQSLEFLPEGLKVGGDLDLGNCDKLKSLPKDLKVGRSLALDNCTSLKSIPKNLKVGREICINPDVSEGTGVKKEDFPERLWNQIKDE